MNTIIIVKRAFYSFLFGTPDATLFVILFFIFSRLIPLQACASRDRWAIKNLHVFMFLYISYQYLYAMKNLR